MYEKPPTVPGLWEVNSNLRIVSWRPQGWPAHRRMKWGSKLLRIAASPLGRVSLEKRWVFWASRILSSTMALASSGLIIVYLLVPPLWVGYSILKCWCDLATAIKKGHLSGKGCPSSTPTRLAAGLGLKKLALRQELSTRPRDWIPRCIGIRRCEICNKRFYLITHGSGCQA
jgi:hypothetical protein